MNKLIFLVIIFLSNCSNHKAKSDLIGNKEEKMKASPSISDSIVSLPFGSELVFYNFSEKIIFSNENSDSLELESINIFDSLVKNTMYNIERVAQNNSSFNENQLDTIFRDINNPFDDRLKITSIKLLEMVGQMGLSSDYYILNYMLELDCNRCEYGNYLNGQSLILMENLKIIDVIPLNYESGNSILSNYRFSYIDKDNVISSRNFSCNEEICVVEKLETYKLKD